MVRDYRTEIVTATVDCCEEPFFRSFACAAHPVDYVATTRNPRSYHVGGIAVFMPYLLHVTCTFWNDTGDDDVHLGSSPVAQFQADLILIVFVISDQSDPTQQRCIDQRDVLPLTKVLPLRGMRFWNVSHVFFCCQHFCT